MSDLERKLEAVLFWRGEPISRKSLAEILDVKLLELNQGIEALKSSLGSRGIVIIEREDEIMLGTHPEFSKLIEDMQKEELNKELSKASLETLSIVLYKGGATRAEIDWIRGVNSTFILRALSVRGLVERVPDPADARRFMYKPTMETLRYLGVTALEELPQYGEINKSMEAVAEDDAK